LLESRCAEKSPLAQPSEAAATEVGATHSAATTMSKRRKRRTVIGAPGLESARRSLYPGETPDAARIPLYLPVPQ